MSLTDFVERVNEYGARRIPFLFFIDFEMRHPVVQRISEISASEILYDLNGFTNVASTRPTTPPTITRHFTLTFEDYKKKFDVVMKHLRYGDSFLTNLTARTRIRISHTPEALFHATTARYKLLRKGHFLVFSPEIFVKMRKGKICSYPMKGTIDAALPNAAQTILNDKKELAEHVTIVDLIRNDLSQVASRVAVTRFRYLEEIRTNQKNLLQVSSEIVGDLPEDYLQRLGNILVALLPAGSVSGAPKPKTLQVIREAEEVPRGYYTGITGYFDGENLDSGVMIRFIEEDEGKFYYRSGGGITTQSTPEDEYRELLDKVYLPVDSEPKTDLIQQDRKTVA